MIEIKRINHVGLRVSNLETAREFYEKLGFAFIIGPIGPEPVAIMEHPSGVNINFILNATDSTPNNILMDIPEKHTGYTHIALEVTSIETVLNQLQTINIAVTGGPIKTSEGSTMIFIRDPDLNVIEFNQPT